MRRRRLILAAAALAALVSGGLLFDAPAALVRALQYIQEIGPAGVVAFIALYVVATVAFIPGSILTLGAGFVFGLAHGTAYVSVGSTLGATAAFLLGRGLLRRWITERVNNDDRFATIDRAVRDEGWKIVLLTRLSPVFPFNVLNYAYGLTSVGAAGYVLASWLGMLPGTVLYVYVGSLAGDLAAAAAGTGIAAAGTAAAADASHVEVAVQTWLRPALQLVGLAATVLVTFKIAAIARAALQRHTGERSP